MLKLSDLTYDEWWLYMPKWQKGIVCFVTFVLPIIGSIEFVGF